MATRRARSSTTTWTFDAAHRLTQFVSSIDGVSDYGYDNINQLTTASHATQSNENYTYDENGNRTTPGYSTDVYNRLSSDGTYTYEYDAEGNRIRRTEISTGAVTDYEWDHRNRLVRVTDRPSTAGPITQTVQHTYDPFNRWITKQVDPDGDGPQSADITHYEYDGNQIVLELNESNSITHRYLWGPAVDQILADEQVGGEVLYPLTDHLGTVRDLLDSGGSVANHIVYDAFGNVTFETDAAVDHLFGYTGRPLDEATGLQNNLNRWYDAGIGQWASEDPIGFAAGDGNLFRYVGNHPTMNADPSGLVEPSAAGFVAIARGVGFVLDIPGHVRWWKTGDRRPPRPERIGVKPEGITNYGKVYHAERRWEGDRAVAFAICFDKNGNQWHENFQGQEGVYDPYQHAFLVDGVYYPFEPRSYDMMLDGSLAVAGVAAAKARGLRAKPTNAATEFATPTPYEGVRKASSYLQEAGVPRNIRKQVLESFDRRAMQVRTAGDSEFGIRYFDNVNAWPEGRYLFETFPASRQSLALQTEWNQMQFFKQWQIRPGTVILEGPAAAQGAYLPGGQTQQYILDIDNLLEP